MYYRDRAQGLLIALQSGPQHLDGEQAVGYARFRHDAQGDLGRIARQRKFIRLIARRMLSPDSVTRGKKLAETFVDTVMTNLTVADVISLMKLVDGVGPEAIRMATLPGRPRIIQGQSLLELDERELQDAVERVLWGQGVSVTVLNGTDVSGLAARAAARLEEHGCDIVEIGNAEEEMDTTAIIDHRGQARRAERVASWLGGGAIAVAPDGDSVADVTVILGRDMVGSGR